MFFHGLNTEGLPACERNYYLRSILTVKNCQQEWSKRYLKRRKLRPKTEILS